ncbi:MAG: Do family serine endopeptidase [Acidobacteria bacterium]|jgi:serine protease Do|nr:Do family serine endopeptidase [Acidobacteriota bacterium]
MKSSGFFGMTVMLSAAVGLGALVATVAPTAGGGQGSPAGPGAAALAPANADLSSLKLAPPAPPAPAVAAPSFADLAERAIPSVVQIASTRYVDDQQDPHQMFRDNPFFRRFFEEEQPQQEEEPQQEQRPRSRPEQSGGSGFFFTTDGYVMTNRHVVEKAEDLRVRTSDDREFEAKLIGIDPYLDLAVIKIEVDAPVPALPLGSSDSLRVGEWVVAIGNPIMYRNSVTAGVVSGKGRRLGFDATELGDYIQTDAAINFGNSGGPLLNARGEVIGINTAIMRNDGNPFRGREGLIEGIGFALPIDAARRSLDQLVATGTVRRGYLGVSVGVLSADAASFYGLPNNKGALVQRVDEDTPAAKAGVKQEDVILAVDGRPVSNSTELVNAISAKRPGESVRLDIWRFDAPTKTSKKLAIDVTLAERRIGLEEEEGRATPTPAPKETDSETSLGITVRPVRPEMRESLEKRGIRGVLVTEVDPASNAYREGLRPGGVITDVNGKPTPTVADFRSVVKGVKPGDVVRVILRSTDGGDQALVFFRAPAAKK